MISRSKIHKPNYKDKQTNRRLHKETKMSIESAKAFMERMKTDEDFRKEITDCKDADTRMKLVEENGFNFSKEELNSSNDELNEDELAAVAGGGWYQDLACDMFPIAIESVK